MNSKIRSIFSLFVISIMVMLMHSIIPHHHHNHSILTHKEDHCQQDQPHSDHKNHEDNHHREEPSPFHCHAFNDSEWYKQDNNNRILVKTTDYIFVLNIEVNEDEADDYFIFKENASIHKELEYFRERFSRPPPTLS